jgi:colicin import membrane protein
MTKLKTFVTETGFFEQAVAAPSMKAALKAWGYEHNAFSQGLARQTEDPAIIEATTAQPGVVLKRPIGSKGAFKADAELPKLKGKPAKRVKKPKADDRARKAAEAALKKARNAHEEKIAALEKKRAALEDAIATAQEEWAAERQKLEKKIP